MTGLQPVTKYYFRAYATNSIGTAYGNQLSVTTYSNLPTLTTEVVSSITISSAKSGGNITYDGYSSIIGRGVCWNTSGNPTIDDNKTIDGTGPGAFTSSITGLQEKTKYYIKAYATNANGTGYGGERSFSTPPAGSPEIVECEKLRISSGSYPETANLIEKIHSELGSNYSIGDWNDLKAISNIIVWISCMGLKEDQQFMITSNGNHFWSGSRHYFVHYSPDGKPFSSFLVHEQIGNILFLGSWYGLNLNILAKKN
ncbi:MAG TPA: hypothetical protein DDW27_04300 [Bacteroidales bacterium]|nr:hypothetical protein [Bacteroidales bacterium]